MLFTLLLAAGIARGCSANAAFGYVFDPNSGLVLTPDLSDVPAERLAKFATTNQFRPFAPLEVQRKLAWNCSVVFDRYALHPNDPQRTEEASQAILGSRRVALFRVLHTLFALIRLPTAWTTDDGRPDRVTAALHEKLRLHADILRPEFELDYDGLDRRKLAEIQRIAKDDAGELNRLVGHAIDDAYEAETRVDAQSFEEKIQVLISSVHWPRFREDLLRQTLTVYARMLQRLLRVLTGRWHSADRFLREDAIRRLTADRCYRLTMAEDWSISPFKFTLYRLPVDSASPDLSQQASLPVQPAGDSHLCNTSVFRLLRFSTHLGLMSLAPAFRTLVVDVWTLVSFAGAAYTLFLDLHLDPPLFNAIRSVERSLKLSVADVMLYVCADGIMTDLFGQYGELFVQEYADVEGIPRSLFELERSLLFAWDLSDGFDLQSNLLIGGILRSRLPAVRSVNTDMFLHRWKRLDPELGTLTYTEFREMRWLLHRTAGELVAQLGLHRLSLVELRVWLLFAVLRAVCLTKNRADGDARSAQLVAAELASEEVARWERFESESVRLRARGAADESTQDLLSKGDHRRFFKEKYLKIALEDVQSIAEESFLQPAAVAGILRILVKLRPDLYGILGGRARWSSQTVEGDAGRMRQIAFRPHQTLSESQPFGEQPIEAVELVHTLAETCHAALFTPVERGSRWKARDEATWVVTMEEAYSLLIYGQLPRSLEKAIDATNQRLAANPGRSLSTEAMDTNVDLFKAIFRLDPLRNLEKTENSL